jgi:hypothetical protein
VDPTWFRGFKQTEKEKEERTLIIGWITAVEFQTMFDVVREAILSDYRLPDYTLWKCVAKMNIYPA